MTWFNLLIGAALLIAGRRLYWLFVAAVGFVVGAQLATEAFAAQAAGWTIWLALGIGLLAALISVFLQRVVVGLAGFFAGGYLLHAFALQQHHASWAWMAFLLGGILGAVLILAVFDWALIVISALMGAALIVQNAPLEPAWSTPAFVALLVLGLVVQARHLVRHKEPPQTE
jgi:hypothetical protein